MDTTIKIRVDPEQPTELPRSKTGQAPLKFRTVGLHVRYGDVLALKDISLNVPANKVTAIIGPSGCGKTTLLNVLARIDQNPALAVLPEQ